MTKPTLYGPSYSTYTRSCRIALAEKGVEYDHEEVNFLGGWPEGYERRHPFRKVPAFSHDGLELYETVAIMRYVDERFPGPALQPESAGDRARMTQVLSIVDAYGYGPLISRTFIPRAVAPMLGGETDEAVIEGAREETARVVSVLDGLLGGGDYFAGGACSLADMHVLPVMHYTSMIPEGQALLGEAPALAAWLDRMKQRASATSTEPQLG